MQAEAAHIRYRYHARIPRCTEDQQCYNHSSERVLERSSHSVPIVGQRPCTLVSVNFKSFKTMALRQSFSIVAVACLLSIAGSFYIVSKLHHALSFQMLFIPKHTNVRSCYGSLRASIPDRSCGHQHVTDFTYGSILAGRIPKRAYDNLNGIQFKSITDFAEANIKGLRVCIFTIEFEGIFPTGGIGYVLSELAKLLATEGANVTVAFLGSGKIDASLLTELANKSISFIKVPEPFIPVVPHHASLVASYRALQFLMNEQDQFDIIHFNDYLGHALFPLYAKRQGWLLEKTKVAITLHGTVMWSQLANKEFPQAPDDINTYWIEREAISTADFIWAPTKYIATSLIAQGVILPENVVVLKNAPPSTLAANPTDNSTLSQELEESSERPTPFINEITFFGRLETRKGPILFIDALVELSRQHKNTLSNITITFLGRDTAVDDIIRSHKETIRSMLHSSDQLKNLTFMFHDNFDRAQAISYISDRRRLVVVPSLVENLPGTVFECIEFGANFIASDVGGIKEMIHSDDLDDCLFKPLPVNLASKLYQKLTASKDEFHLIRHAETPESIKRQIIKFHQEIYQTEYRTVLKQTKKSWPKVTVCLTHYDRPTILLAALSKWKMQKYNNFDLIVVDDESPLDVQKGLDLIMAPFKRTLGWKLIKVKHGYLGAARNKCVVAANPDTEYIFFTDDDDYVADDGLQRLLDIAQHTVADIVTSFFHQFSASTLEEASARKTESIWMFAGGSLATGIPSNIFGGALMLVSVKAFHTIGGFSEFDMVGCEDWEFYVQATIKGLKIEIVPQHDLLYIQKKNISMSTTMDHKLCSFRSLSPIVSKYPALADSFLLLRGLLDSRINTNHGTLQIKSSHHIGMQKSNGWEYGYCVHDVGTAVTVSECDFQHFPDFVEENPRYDMHSLSGTIVPFVGQLGMHPGNVLFDGFLKSVTVVRKFKSFLIGNMSVLLHIHHTMTCGDGVLATLILNSDNLFEPKHILPDSNPIEWHSKTFKISTEDTILLMVSPMNNHQCDSIAVDLVLSISEETFQS